MILIWGGYSNNKLRTEDHATYYYNYNIRTYFKF